MPNRSDVIKRALDAYHLRKDRRTLTVPIRGEQQHLQVIRVTPSNLLLNHDNSRLVAQLEEHSKNKIVMDNPESHEAQEVLSDLLRNTEKFKELKAQLKDLGQQEPGLITRSGLLVNGNTRMVALKDLESEGKSEGIDVAVLPGDINTEVLMDIEMTLQMTKLTHQDYSFTNELIMMNRYKLTGKTNAELARKMGWIRRGIKKVEQHLRIFKIIEEVRHRSDPKLPFSVFDSKKQHLIDLDDSYQLKKMTGELDAAEEIKWTRIAAIILHINKDHVRSIDESGFIKEQIMGNRGAESDSDSEVVGFLEQFEQPEADDGLDAILSIGGDTQGINSKMLVTHILKSADLRNSEGGIKKDLDGTIAKLSRKFRQASLAKINQDNIETMKAEPAEVLNEIRLQLEDLKEKFPEISSYSGFKSGDVRYQLRKLDQLVVDLKYIVDQHIN
jgi:hypothetical protein